MTTLSKHLSWSPSRIAGVSGGALAGAAFLSGQEETLLEAMCAAFDHQDSNLDLFHAGDTGLTPHQTIYCDVVDAVIDAAAADRIANGPKFQILIAHPPEGRAARAAGTAMALAYEAELHLINAPHFNWAEKLGLDAQLVDANQAARDGKLTDLICAAAVIPPVFEPPDWNGRPVVDGGMADQAPMPDPNSGETLILLTREYNRLPNVAGRTYISPSHETPADKIDFTDPKKLRDTWAQGAHDAKAALDLGSKA